MHEPEPALVKEATLYQYGLISEAVMRALLLSTRPTTLQGKVYGESNQKLSSVIPLLAALFPACKFIWLVRDGRDVVASTYYARRWYLPVEELAPDRVKPFTTPVKEWHWFRLRGDLTGNMSTAAWEALSRFEKNCWLWAKTNAIIRDHLAALPAERWLLARLETLPAQLPDIGRFLDIRAPAMVPEEDRHNASAIPPTPWEDWPGDHQALFERCCGEMMDQLYPGWRTTTRERRAPPAPPRPKRRWLGRWWAGSRGN